MTSKKRMPRCVGHYDIGDTTCDGDPKGATDEDKMPCVFRDRCAALQKHCSESGHQPQDYVELRKLEDVDGEKRRFAIAKADDDVFSGQLARWAKRWGIRNGRVTLTTPIDPEPKKNNKPKKKRARDIRIRQPPSADARRKAAKAIADSAETSVQEAYQMASWFNKQLETHTQHAFVTRASEARPGEMFIVDRMRSSRYVAVYCRAEKQRKVAVASIYPQTRAESCQIRFPVPPESFDELPGDYKRLGIVSINDGRFKSKTGKLDREGLAMAAEAVARLAERGTIKLPSE